MGQSYIATVIPAQAGIQNGNAKDRHTAHLVLLDSRLRGNDGCGGGIIHPFILNSVEG